MRPGHEHPAEHPYAGTAARRHDLVERLDWLRAKTVEQRDAVHAGHGAERRAALLAGALAQHIVGRVLGQRDPGISALLRAPMHQTVFADVEIAAAGPALPVIRAAEHEVALE